MCWEILLSFILVLSNSLALELCHGAWRSFPSILPLISNASSQCGLLTPYFHHWCRCGMEDVSVVMMWVFFSQLQTQRGEKIRLFSWSCPGKSTLCLAASDGEGEEQQHSPGQCLTLRAVTVPGCNFSFYQCCWILGMGDLSTNSG